MTMKRSNPTITDGTARPFRRRRNGVLVAVAVLALAACATTDSVSGFRMYIQPRALTWEAAVAAMHDIGAHIVVSNRSSGLLAGEVRRAELGGRVRLDVTVRASAANQDGSSDGSDINVGVIYQGGIPDDPHIREDLVDLKDQYMEAVDRNLAMGRRRGMR